MSTFITIRAPEVYRVNNWIFVVDNETGVGWVYYPEGQTACSIAACFGSEGDQFKDAGEAIAYFRTADPDQPL